LGTIDEGASEQGRPAGRAAHWVQFYAQLVEFETRILQTMEEHARNLPRDQFRAVELTNLKPMRELIADFERRRDRWREAAGSAS
jgi:hypothetical protein